MKAINLFFDMEFTSLSPDARVISLGIVSEDILPDNLKLTHYTDKNGIVGEISKIEDSPVYDGKYHKIFKDEFSKSKSFYAEFTDFDINRCDDWVKENVVGKLKYLEAVNSYDKYQFDAKTGNVSMSDTTSEIKACLKEWLKQFSGYQITFVKDAQSTKGTGLDWLNLVELIRIDNLPKDWSYIKLTRNYLVMVDRDKHDELSKFKWYSVISESNPLNCYAAYKINGKVVKMHRYLMGDPPFVGACVDHINGNSLDNRVSNLRWVTPRQNNMNVRPSKSKCKFKGVCFRGQINKYEARITDNGKTVTIGYYDTEIEAAKAYNKKSIEVFGEYARPNQLDNFPKLPSNISPVALDLNDLIAFKKGISVKEAFDWNREELAFGIEKIDSDSVGENIKPLIERFNSYLGETNTQRIEFAKYMIGQTFDEHNVKHNSLWDAKVIKSIYNKLI